MKNNNYFLYDDYLSISFTDRNKAHYQIGRTKTVIKHKVNSLSHIKPCLWELNSLGGENSDYQIIWNEDICAYELKSSEVNPFIHNGVMSFHSIIRRGDHVDIGFNRLDFYGVKNKEETNIKNVIPWKSWDKDSFILLVGETGTGKTSLAKMIHKNLHCELKPFVHINISSFAKGLIESELFGHEEGAFTGAGKLKKGAIELASDGTLFIDEIDSLDSAIQVKLLTFLDDFKYRRVGGERELQAKCRIIFASGTCLKERVKGGDMRSDFYFRIISGLSHRLKPLRECPEAIREFIKNFEKKYHITVCSKLENYLLNCPWPGNYRQLSSFLNQKRLLDQRSLMISHGELDYDLKDDLKGFDIENNVIIPLKKMKKKYCEKAYYQCRGSLSETSKTLEVSRNTLKSILAS